MSLIVGSARIDENGNIKGGSAGDQTGKEVVTQEYYVHSKGWYCSRPINVGVANGIAQAMLDACNNSYIGYDQWQRDSLLTQWKKTGSIKDIKVKCETDCSALIRVCVLQASGKDVGNIRTTTMKNMLNSSGIFKDAFEVTPSTILYNGDVLFTKTTGHTVAVVSGRARTSNSSTVTSSKLTVDGMWGQATTKAAQKFLGTTVDGIVSNQPSSCKKYLINADTNSWKFRLLNYSGGSLMIKALQKKIGTKKIDGFMGKNTVKELQKYLNNNGCNLTVDGLMGSATVKAWQKFLNSKM